MTKHRICACIGNAITGFNTGSTSKSGGKRDAAQEVTLFCQIAWAQPRHASCASPSRCSSLGIVRTSSPTLAQRDKSSINTSMSTLASTPEARSPASDSLFFSYSSEEGKALSLEKCEEFSPPRTDQYCGDVKDVGGRLKGYVRVERE